MTDDERLEDIRKRVYAATLGPWIVNNSMGRLHIESLPTPIDNDEDFLGVVYGMHDADFIAHAREDIPWLLAEVERLRGMTIDKVYADHIGACTITLVNGTVIHGKPLR